MKQRAFRAVATLVAALLASGCGGGGGGNSSAPPDPDEPSPVSEFAFVTSTDFQSGSYSTVNLRDQSTRTDLPAGPGIVESDNSAVYYDNRFYVINRFGFDNITVLDAFNLRSPIKQFSTGNGSNPQDMAFRSGRHAYVSLYGSNDLLVVDPLAAAGGEILGRIDLSGFLDPRDADGLVEASSLARVGPYLFVVLQSLDNFSAVRPGRLAVIDIRDDRLVDVDPSTPGTLDPIVLTGANPTALRYIADLGLLWVSETGVFGAEDGGVEAVDPFTFEVLGQFVRETDLNGDVGDLAVSRGAKGYVVGGGFSTNRVHVFDVTRDPDSGALEADGFGDLGFEAPFVPALALDRSARLLVPDRTLENPGLRIFDTLDDAELSDGPIDLGLPPNTVLTAPPQPPTALVITTDFQTGSYSTVNLLDGTARRDRPAELGIVESDADAVFYANRVYILNRFGFDNISVLDVSDLDRAVKQFSVGNGGNPQDMAFVAEDHAYVSLYGSNDLLIVDPSAADGEEIVGRIGLGRFLGNDADGLVEATDLALVGRYLFVTLQRLTNFQPARPGVLAVIDTETDTLVDADPDTPEIDPIVLSGENPTSLRYAPGLGRLVVTVTGEFGVLDGGIEAVNPFSFTAEGRILTELDVGADLGDLVVVRGGKGYVVSGGFQENRIKVFDLDIDPADGVIRASGLRDLGVSMPFIDALSLDEGDRLLVPDRTLTNPGVRVFDTFADRELTAAPIDVGLPPNKVLVLYGP